MSASACLLVRRQKVIIFCFVLENFKIGSESDGFLFLADSVKLKPPESKWLPCIDSNYDKMIQNHLCYHYTTRQLEGNHNRDVA